MRKTVRKSTEDYIQKKYTLFETLVENSYSTTYRAKNNYKSDLFVNLRKISKNLLSTTGTKERKEDIANILTGQVKFIKLTEFLTPLKILEFIETAQNFYLITEISEPDPLIIKKEKDTNIKKNEDLLKEYNTKYDQKYDINIETLKIYFNFYIEEKEIIDLFKIKFPKLKTIKIFLFEYFLEKKFKFIQKIINTYNQKYFSNSIKFFIELNDSFQMKKKLNFLQNIPIENISGLSISHYSYGCEKEFLSKIKLTNLIELEFSFNIDINALVQPNLSLINLKKLVIMSSRRKMGNLSGIEKLNCPLLQELHITGNSIENISILNKVKFKNLEILDLFHNSIDINKNDKIENFPFINNLKVLNLSNNHISSLDWIENVKLTQLQVLALNNNKIKDFDIFEKLSKNSKINDNSLNKLSVLYLNGNDIEKYNGIKDINLKNLRFLLMKNLPKNDLNDIKEALFNKYCRVNFIFPVKKNDIEKFYQDELINELKNIKKFRVICTYQS